MATESRVNKKPTLPIAIEYERKSAKEIRVELAFVEIKVTGKASQKDTKTSCTCTSGANLHKEKQNTVLRANLSHKTKQSCVSGESVHLNRFQRNGCKTLRLL